MTVPTPTCYRHPSRPTYLSCTRCGRPICPDCMTTAAVGFQCPDCVQEGKKSVRAVRTVFGGRVHDVIGTRCDPYTNRLLSGGDYHHCCHSNLCRALSRHQGIDIKAAEPHVHDVLNVFMCTGFTRDTQQYFMKASPVRPGDFLEMFAEIDLLGALSACPGGDCSTSHSSDVAKCYPLMVEIYRPDMALLAEWPFPERNGYQLQV